MPAFDTGPSADGPRDLDDDEVPAAATGPADDVDDELAIGEVSRVVRLADIARYANTHFCECGGFRSRD